jgi:hypothetical protein
MDMLCIAAAHDPIGYVAVAGQGLNETSVAHMTGGEESEVAILLGELERNGVFSRDRHGRIYSRRMLADAKKAARARKNGKLGGNPRLGKAGGNPASDNLKDKGQLKPHKPEARSQNNSEDKSSGGEAAEPDFDREAWTIAVAVFTEQGAMTEPNARRLFGKMLSTSGLQAKDMLPSLVSARVTQTRDPQSYLTRSAEAIAKRRTPAKPKHATVW